MTVMTAGLYIHGSDDKMQQLAECIRYALENGFDPAKAISDGEFSICSQLGMFDEDEDDKEED